MKQLIYSIHTGSTFLQKSFWCWFLHFSWFFKSIDFYFFVVSSGCAIHWPMTKDLVTTWKGIQRFHFTRLPFLIRIYRRKISKLIYVTTHACLIGSKIYTQNFSGFEIWNNLLWHMFSFRLNSLDNFQWNLSILWQKT